MLLRQGICEGMWLERLLKERQGKTRDRVRMFSDSQAATHIAKNPVHQDRTKHIEIDRHYISDNLINGIVQLTYVPTKHQFIDILTKALPSATLFELQAWFV